MLQPTMGITVPTSLSTWSPGEQVLVTVLQKPPTQRSSWVVRRKCQHLIHLDTTVQDRDYPLQQEMPDPTPGIS